MKKKKIRKNSQKVAAESIGKKLNDDSIIEEENSINPNDVVFQQPLDEDYLGIGAMTIFCPSLHHASVGKIER